MSDSISITFNMSSKELELFSDVNILGINEAIATRALNFWTTLAGQNMTRTRKYYVESLKMEPAGGSSYRVHLGELGPRPSFAAILEVGSGSYDLKPGFLANAKTDANGGRYRIIPIGKDPDSFSNPSFRIVRPGDPGWEHPGFPGWKFQDMVVEEAAEVIIDEVIDMWFDGRL